MPPSTTTTPSPTYRILLLPPPPLSLIAPNGFPTPPFPSTAPPLFLDAMSIRVRVFCEEQGCSLDNEIDEDDGRSFSWILYVRGDDKGEEGDGGEGRHGWRAVSTVRMVMPHGHGKEEGKGEEGESYIKLSRVATLPEYRGRGYSRILIREAIEWLRRGNGDQIPTTTTSHQQDTDGNGEKRGRKWNGLFLTHAQIDVEGMYKKLGFVTDETMGRWEEEGIEHVGMWLRIDMRVEA